MKKIIGIILIVIALLVGYLGITTIDDSGGSIDVLGVEISASDSEQKTQGYIYLGVAVLSLVGGIALVSKK